MFWFCFSVIIKSSQVGYPLAVIQVTSSTLIFTHLFWVMGVSILLLYILKLHISNPFLSYWGGWGEVATGIQIACFRCNMVRCEIETADWWETLVSNKYKLVCLVKSYPKQYIDRATFFFPLTSTSWSHHCSLGQQSVSEASCKKKKP